MRLYNVHTREFKLFNRDLPRYVVVSHRWTEGAETSFQEVQKSRNLDKKGYRKLEGCATYVKAYISDVEWLWMDTCCINQRNDAELSEAVNSMFKWYRGAELCLAYLADVDDCESGEEFRRSTWFTRGWTLQELIASGTIIFLAAGWKVIGYKRAGKPTSSGQSTHVDRRLEPLISSITGIPEAVLLDTSRLSEFSSEDKLKWAEGRSTTREEDMSYCMFGILDVALGANYGEGAERARKRLLEEIRKEGIEGTLPSPSHNIPFRRDRDYVAREELTGEMLAKLSMPAGRLALVGVGGVGKSQLAIEYAYRLRERSPMTWVFWMHASNAARFEQALWEMAEQMKIPQRRQHNADIFDLVMACLRDETKGPWLIVLDNVDDAEFLLQSPVAAKHASTKTRFEYLPICEHGSLLITSRSIEEATKLIEYSDVLTVSPLSKGDAFMLLEKKLNMQTDEKDITELTEALDFFPLAISQAAAYIVQLAGRCTVRRYIEKLRRSERSKKSILSVAIKDHRRDKDARNAIVLTWQLSFEHIYQVRPSAAKLLSLLSFCDPQSIPDMLARNLRKDNAAVRQGGKIRARVDNNLGWAAEEGRGSAETGNDNPQHESRDRFPRRAGYGNDEGDEDEDNDENHDNSDNDDDDDDDDDEFEKDVAILEGYSFLRPTTNYSMFDLHRLVQYATQWWLLSRDEFEDSRDQYISTLSRVFPQGQHEHWEICETLFPHAKAASGFEVARTTTTLQLAKLIHNAASYICDCCRSVSDAVELATRAVKMRAETLGDNHRDTLLSKLVLGAAQAAIGEGEGPELFELLVLEELSSTLGKENRCTLTAMYARDKALVKSGRSEEAEALLSEVVESSSKVLGEEHIDTLRAKVNLASAYRDRGKLQEAEVIMMTAYKASSDSLGEEHPQTLNAEAQLAKVFLKQDRLEEAEQLRMRFLRALPRIFGKESVVTMMAKIELAWALFKTHRAQEAEELQLEAVNVSIETFGTESAAACSAMAALALMQCKQGQWAKAEEWRVRVLGGNVSSWGALITVGSLATEYRDSGQLESAEQLDLKVMNTALRVLGEEHRVTQTAILNLATTYHGQGRYDKAEELNLQALSVLSRTYGEGHEMALICMENLGVTYSSQGKETEAEQIILKTKEMRQMELGEKHPDTLRAMKSLALTYR